MGSAGSSLLARRSRDRHRLPFLPRVFSYADALAYCSNLQLAGRTDWRLPSIKELYSLADNRGELLKPVSGEADVYGMNAFAPNGDGTVTDNATGLMWQQADDGIRREWAEALAYCEALELAGHDDWRLPDSKALQSIVDYHRTSFPAIDEAAFSITDDGETLDFWTSTTCSVNACDYNRSDNFVRCVR